MQELLDKNDVCERLGISPRTLNRLIQGGQITPVRIGTCVRFAPSDLAAFVAGHRDEPRHDVERYLQRLESLLPDLTTEQRCRLAAVAAPAA